MLLLILKLYHPKPAILASTKDSTGNTGKRPQNHNFFAALP